MNLHRWIPLLLAVPLHAAAADWPACGEVDTYPGTEWPAPQAGSWNAELLDEARSLSENRPDGAAVMVVHQGRLVARWGEVAVPRLVQSVRKQLLSSLVGLEVAAGRLAPDDTLAELDIQDTEPPLTDFERRATVRDLLESRSGIYHNAHYEVGGWKRIREQLRALEADADEIDALEPGEYWFYNNWDFNALGTIVQRSAGRGIGPYFTDAVATPIGMQDFRPDLVEYTGKGDLTARMMDNHSEHPAYAFRISSRDLARYGLLWLGCGRWGEGRVLSKDWVLASITGRDTLEGANPAGFQKDFGYFGYLWWVNRGNRPYHAGLPTDVDLYYASGAGGHNLFIIPSLDLVIAHVVETPGGVGTFSQIRRRLFGGPDLSDREVGEVISRIIASHPGRGH